MSRTSDHDRAALGEALRRVRPPDASGAEERAWRVVRAAHAERAPVGHALPRARRRFALALAGGVAIAAIALTPAGAKVGELVTETLGIDSEQALPELRRLPAAGELLVESADGVWIVRADGSKRLLGGYAQASWSPRARFVVAAADDELVALAPDGEVQWTVDARGAVRDPRWGGTAIDTRIAYRSAGDLRVVAGDGTGERVVARDVAPVAPAWLPVPAEAKVALGSAVPVHALAFLDRDRSVRVVDADSGRSIEPVAAWRAHLRALRTGAAPARSGDRSARIVERGARSALVVRSARRSEVLFSGPGRLTDPVWSPDGRWLLVGWRDADQWLFIDASPRPGDRRRPRLVPIDAVSRQFDPGGAGAGGFPVPSLWALPER